MRSRIPLIIRIAAFLIVGILVAFGLLLRYRQATASLPSVIRTELRTVLDRDVRIGSVRITSSGSATITGVAIADGPTFDTGTIFTVPRAYLRLRILDFILGRTTIPASIQSITLVNPSLRMVRKPDGTWNVADLVRRPPLPAERRFSGLIRIQSGRITVVDYSAQTPRTPATNTVNSVSGRLDFSPPSSFIVDLTGRGTTDRLGRARVAGRWGLPEEITRLNLTLENVVPAYWLDYFSNISKWGLNGGRASASAVLTVEAGQIVVRGNASLRGSAFTSPQLTIPIRPFAANIRFVGRNLSISGTGYLGQSPVSVSGNILGFAPARMNLRVTSDRMNLRTLHTAIRSLPRVPQVTWDAPGVLSVSIQGTGRDPHVTGSISTQRFFLYGRPVSNVIARGYYRNLVIRVTSLTGRSAGGDIGLTANVMLDPALRITARGRGVGLALRGVPVLDGYFTSGVADARFSIDYQRGLRAATVTANARNVAASVLVVPRGSVSAVFTGPRSAVLTVRTQGGSLQGIPMTSGSANLRISDRHVVVQDSEIALRRGRASIRGSAVIGGPLDLAVDARDVETGSILRPLGYPQFEGTADFAGRVTGTTPAPRVQGNIVARNGRIRGVQYDYLSGRLIATQNALVLEDVVLRRLPTEVATTGRITIARGRPLELQVAVRSRGFQLSELFGLLGIPVRARGVVASDLTISGRYPNLEISGSVDVADAVVAGERIDSARIRLEHRQGTTFITDLFAQRDAMRIVGSGQVNRTGELEIDLLGENLNLSLLNDVLSPYVVIDGPATFAGQIRGTVSRPLIIGNLASANPVLNGQSFESFLTRLAWNGTELVMSDAALSGDGTTFNISRLSFNPRTTVTEFRATVTSGSIARVIALFRNSPFTQLPAGETIRRFLATLPSPFSGAYNASVNLSGPLVDLNGNAALVMDGVQLGDQVVNHAEIDLLHQRAVFLLNRISVSSPGVTFDASAVFEEAKPVSVSASISDTSISSLVDLIAVAPILPVFDFGQALIDTARDFPRPLAGRINGSLSLANLQTDPSGTLSINADDLSVEQTLIGNVTAQASLSRGTVFLDRVAVTQPEGEAVAQGSVNPDGLLTLTGQGTDIPLSILNPWLRTDVTSGRANFQFRTEGSAENPLVDASITVEDVAVAGRSMDSIVAQNLTIAAGRLSSDSVVVSNNGSQLILSGSVPFAFRAPFVIPDQPVMVRAEIQDPEFRLVNSILPGIESSSGVFSATVDMTGTIDDPILAGRVAVNNGFLNMRGFENDFSNLNLLGTFTGSTLVIETFTGQSSLGGSFSGGGNITVSDLSNISQSPLTLFLSLDAMRFDMANFTGQGERLTFTSTGQLTAVDNLGSPSLQGQLVVTDARLRLPPEIVTTTVRLPRLPITPRLGITLNLTRNVEVQRGSLRAQIIGPVTVTGTASAPVIGGTVQIASGTLRYVGRTLDLLPGGTSSFILRPPQPAVITVDVSARTRFTALSPITGRATRYTAFLDISGPIGNLNIDVRSSPPGLSDTQVLALVFGGAALQALVEGVPPEQVIQQQLGQILLGVAVPGLFEPLELGVFTLAIEPGLDVPFQATISTALTEKFVLSYSRTLVGRIPTDTFGISYTLSPRLALTVQFEGRQGTSQDTTFLVQYFTRF